MTIRNIKAMFAALLLALLVCFGAVMGGQGNLSAFAATDVQTAYENTNVLDNLEGSTIGGKEFDIADYPHNDSGVPQIISLIEFCYSYYADKQTDFGLYVYVYNPQDIAFDMATDRNKIQLTYGDKLMQYVCEDVLFVVVIAPAGDNVIAYALCELAFRIPLDGFDIGEG